MDVVVCAEWYDLLVGSYIVHYTAPNSVNVEVVAVHECHATQEEYASANFAQGFIVWVHVHLHDALD